MTWRLTCGLLFRKSYRLSYFASLRTFLCLFRKLTLPSLESLKRHSCKKPLIHHGNLLKWPLASGKQFMYNIFSVRELHPCAQCLDPQCLKMFNRINTREDFICSCNYRVARKFCGSFILRIGDFLWFAGTNFCGSRWLKYLLGLIFLRCSVQVAEHLSGRNLNIFSFYCTACWVTVHSTYVLVTNHCNTLTLWLLSAHLRALPN